jgi:hypothetical protein
VDGICVVQQESKNIEANNVDQNQPGLINASLFFADHHTLYQVHR